MLILRRKKNESLLIGDNIRITVIDCGGDGVRLAIDAPKQISILREELSEAEQSNKIALAPNMDSVLALQSILKQKKNYTDPQKSPVLNRWGFSFYSFYFFSSLPSNRISLTIQNTGSNTGIFSSTA